MLDMKSKYVHVGAEKTHAKAWRMALAENIYNRELLPRARTKMPSYWDPERSRARHVEELEAAGVRALPVTMDAPQLPA